MMSGTNPSPQPDSSGFWLPPTPPREMTSSGTAGTVVTASLQERPLDAPGDALMIMPVIHLAGLQSRQAG